MDYLALSPEMQAVLRVVYATLLLLTLGLTLPNARRFFGTESSGGYADPTPWLDRLLSTPGRVMILSSWFAAATWLLVGKHTVLASLMTLVFARIFFVNLRWRSIARGMGAPGFMLYWLGALVFFLEYTAHYDPQGWLRQLAILTFKVDLAVIFLCAGQYKLFSGYPQNNGMERGMVNPWWGYWWRAYRRLPPGHWLFRGLNHLAYLTELATAVLMLIPATSEWGGLLLAATFVFIGLNIRLGFLCETVICCCLLFCLPGGLVDSWLGGWMQAQQVTPQAGMGWLNLMLGAFLLFYVLMLPITKAGLYWNFYARRRLPDGWQRWQDFWANLMGIIIWRVFTIDNTNFYVKAWWEDRATGQRTLYSRPGQAESRTDFRYVHVCEFVCFVSVFTTLKYFPSDSELFRKRLLRYAASIPTPEHCRLVFEYIDIRKTERFEDVSSREFRVDAKTGEIEERWLADGTSATDHQRYSELHQGHRVGSYAPSS